MTFSSQDYYYNIVEVSNLIKSAFNNVTNKEELQDLLIQFVNQNEISLFRFSGEIHRKMLVDAINRGIRHHHFDLEQGQNLLLAFKNDLMTLNERENRLYTQQTETPGVIKQLQDKGYVDSRHLLTETDIQQALDHSLPNSKVHAAPISITDLNNMEVLKATLRQNNEPVLYIPANLYHNHWVLLVLKQDEQGTHFTCWDPQKGTENTIHRSHSDLLNNLALAVTELYGETADIKYEYGNEQEDGFTCGYRVVRKIMDEMEIDNDFTTVPIDDPDKMYIEFIKLLASKDPALKEIANDLQVVVEDDSFTVYRDDIAFQNREELTGIIRNKRSIQEQADKFLAIVLQDVYFSDPEIQPKDAMALAQEKMKNLKLSELQQKEEELVAKLTQKEKEFKPRGTIAKAMPFFKQSTSDTPLSKTPSQCGLESEENALVKQSNDALVLA